MGLSKAKGGVGYRDLAIFNKALLAKQLWRIIKNPDSLVAQVLKAKYFPQVKALEANLGTWPSLAWRSLLSTKELVCKGAIWKVGDGKDIRVWGDCWIPKPTSFSMQSPWLTLNEDTLVWDLMDKESNTWNRSLIEQNLWKEEAEAILNIPLSPFLPKDQSIWRCTKNRNFSVQSAYHLGLEVWDKQNPSSLVKMKANEIWKMC
jgi:hypothetical protein